MFITVADASRCLKNSSRVSETGKKRTGGEVMEYLPLVKSLLLG